MLYSSLFERLLLNSIENILYQPAIDKTFVSFAKIKKNRL